MGRYDFTSIKLNRDGKRVFRPTMYPHIPIRDSDVFIYPKFGDRLDNLAFKYYGDVSLWWIIAKANGYSHESRPKPGVRIRIPRNISVILDEFKRINTKR